MCLYVHADGHVAQLQWLTEPVKCIPMNILHVANRPGHSRVLHEHKLMLVSPSSAVSLQILGIQIFLQKCWLPIVAAVHIRICMLLAVPARQMLATNYATYFLFLRGYCSSLCQDSLSTGRIRCMCLCCPDTSASADGRHTNQARAS